MNTNTNTIKSIKTASELASAFGNFNLEAETTGKTPTHLFFKIQEEDMFNPLVLFNDNTYVEHSYDISGTDAGLKSEIMRITENTTDYAIGDFSELYKIGFLFAMLDKDIADNMNEKFEVIRTVISDYSKEK